MDHGPFEPSFSESMHRYHRNHQWNALATEGAMLDDLSSTTPCLEEKTMPTHRIRTALAVIGLLLVAESIAGGANATEDQNFSVVIRNVSNSMTLRISDSETRAVPVAPGAYAVVSKDATIFRTGSSAGASGLEALAEDGNADPLIAFLKSQPDVKQAGLFVPGQAFTVAAEPGDRLVFAAMFVESNDLFFGSDSAGISFFDPSGVALNGDITNSIGLWDAGTEINEQPGIGQFQAPRQPSPDSGPAENGTVRPVEDGFDYPEVADVLAVTVSVK